MPALEEGEGKCDECQSNTRKDDKKERNRGTICYTWETGTWPTHSGSSEAIEFPHFISLHHQFSHFLNL